MITESLKHIRKCCVKGNGSGHFRRSERVCKTKITNTIKAVCVLKKCKSMFVRKVTGTVGRKE